MAAPESGTYISDFDPASPDGAVDPKSEGDDHLRLIKQFTLNTFPNITGEATSTHTELNTLTGVSATVTSTELDFLENLTENVQVGMDAKAPLAGATFTGIVKQVETVSGADPSFQFYNTTIGGGTLRSDGTTGDARIHQADAAGVYEKHWIKMERDGAVSLYHNGVLRLETLNGGGGWGVNCPDVLITDGLISTSTIVATSGSITSSVGDVVATAGRVQDQDGQLKAERTAATSGTLSGTSEVFSSIPTGVTKIRFAFYNVSFSTNNEDIALVVNTGTGYEGRSHATSSGGAIFYDYWGSKAQLTSDMDSSHKVSGHVTLHRIGGAHWSVDSQNSGPTPAGICNAAGHIIVSGDPTSVTFSSNSGTAVFDSGAITMYYTI